MVVQNASIPATSDSLVLPSLEATLGSLEATLGSTTTLSSVVPTRIDPVMTLESSFATTENPLPTSSQLPSVPSLMTSSSASTGIPLLSTSAPTLSATPMTSPPTTSATVCPSLFSLSIVPTEPHIVEVTLALTLLEHANLATLNSVERCRLELKIVEAFQLGWISNPTGRRRRQVVLDFDSDVSHTVQPDKCPSKSIA